MFKRLAFATVALASLSGSVANSCGSTVLQQDFNQYAGDYRLYTEDDAVTDFGDARPDENDVSVGPGLIFIKGGKGRGDRVSVGEGHLRVEHPKGCVGTNECGVLFSVRLPEPLQSATLTYRVRFDEDYDWTRGGKLPGLCDEDCPTGCASKDEDGGWSGRVHWRADGALTSYMYLPGGDQSCGQDINWEMEAQANEWFELRIFYSMNTPGDSDGELKVWVDGDLVQHTTGIIYDNTGTHLIERLKFDNFHGGKSDKFRPGKTQYVWMDDLKVQEGQCAPSGSRTTLPESERLFYPNVGKKIETRPEREPREASSEPAEEDLRETIDNSGFEDDVIRESEFERLSPVEQEDAEEKDDDEGDKDDDEGDEDEGENDEGDELKKEEHADGDEVDDELQDDVKVTVTAAGPEPEKENGDQDLLLPGTQQTVLSSSGVYVRAEGFDYIPDQNGVRNLVFVSDIEGASDMFDTVEECEAFCTSMPFCSAASFYRDGSAFGGKNCWLKIMEHSCTVPEDASIDENAIFLFQVNGSCDLDKLETEDDTTGDGDGTATDGGNSGGGNSGSSGSTTDVSGGTSSGEARTASSRATSSPTSTESVSASGILSVPSMFIAAACFGAAAMF